MWALPSLPVPKRRPRRAPGRDFRPRVEALEDRHCPSGGSLQWADPTGGGPLRDVAVQPDGKVLAVADIQTGYRAASPTYGMQVLRLNADGSPDTAFGTNGSATVAVSGSAYGTAIAVQPDGKILIGGRASIANDKNGQEYIVARLNPNGTLDTTFGNGGKKGAGGGLWQYNPTASAERVVDLSVLTDSFGQMTGIMVEGEGYTAIGRAFAAMKLTPAGQTDTTYGAGGSTLLNLGGLSNSPQGMAVTPGGGAVLVGYTSQSAAIAVLTPAGQLDTGFNGTGYRLDNAAGAVNGTLFYDVAVQPVGTGYRYVVSGSAGLGGPYGTGVVMGYTSAGQLDSTFATGGLFLTAAVTEFVGVGLEADGSIALAGNALYQNPSGDFRSQIAVGHLFADGTPDTAFGTAGNGFSVLPPADPASGDQAYALAMAPDGGFVVAGAVNDQMGIVKFSAP